MNICIRRDEVFINDIYVGKMDILPFDKFQIEQNPTVCFFQIIIRFVKTFLKESTIDYLLRRFSRYHSRESEELFSLWINREKVFESEKVFNQFIPIAQLLLIAMDFIVEFKDNQDRMWLILQNLDQAGFGVERKINVLNPELRKFVLRLKNGDGLLSADFSIIVLPCFKAIVRDLMGVGQ